MTQLQTIVREVASLSPCELAEFRQWFIEFDACHWDRQIEEDAATGRLDRLAEAALKSLRGGDCPSL